MRNLRILVVDPHLDGAESLTTLLGLWGHEARIATDGSSALGEVRSFRPDLVLAETDLADMDGTELVSRIAAACDDRKPPLLAGMSVAHDPDDRHYRAELAFDYQFGKPLNLAFLNRVLQFHRDRLGQPSEPFPRRILPTNHPEGSRCSGV